MSITLCFIIAVLVFLCHAQLSTYNLTTEPMTADGRIIINVGLLFVKDTPGFNRTIGYRNSAGAILIAQDRIRADKLLDKFWFNYTVMFDECVERNASGMTVDLIRDYNADVIIGPSCTQTAISSGPLASYYNIPMYIWGQTIAISAVDSSRVTTATLMSVTTYSLAITIRDVLIRYEWKEFSFLYSLQGDAKDKCDNMKNDLMSVLANNDNVRLATAIELTDMTTPTLTRALRNASDVSRVMVTCLEVVNGYKRAFMLTAKDLNMTNEEYVYIIADTRSKGWRMIQELSDDLDIWLQDPKEVQDGRNAEALEAFQKAFVISNIGPTADTDEYFAFSNATVKRIADPPFSCTTDCKASFYTRQAGLYAYQLHDSFYAYAMSLNWTIGNATNVTSLRNDVIQNGALVHSHSEMSFNTAFRGKVSIDSSGLRTSQVFLLGITPDGTPTQIASFWVYRNSSDYSQDSNDSVVWKAWGGKKPSYMPKCGYLHDQCPPSFIEENLAWIIVVACVVGVIFLAALLAMYFLFRARQKEIERQDTLWQIPFLRLQTLKKKSKSEASFRSLQSGPSVSTRTTMESRHESSHMVYFMLQQEMVAAMKHSSILNLDERNKVHLRQLRQLDHENLDRFLGLVLDGPQLLSIWRFCFRGSIRDVIMKATMNMDAFFVYALMRDIASGLNFIHSSYLGYHGWLTSETCLVDDRWQVKIGYYGIQSFSNFAARQKKDLLWTAPEHLRAEDSGSQAGDIYSFAVICSELVTRKSAWGLRENGNKEAAVLHQVKKFGGIPKRPDLTIHESMEINPAILHMIRDCWSEKPSDRPHIEQVRSILRALEGRNFNLMDHMFNLLESYAATLEEEVEERTKELTEEKKRSDVLLNRMLPKQVAERLKLGQSVPPESFDNVTVFFSDVVSFTTLASKCTPLQVVTLLNDLYTNFDRIIDAHQVYKVETIGDGYLCVSGLPHRNGNEHIREICSMALGFLESLVTFRVPHLPNERISLRVGIHSGPVVAGVVGLTMPRYCLFGDTVNTASRMESNGKADRVHLSPDANRMVQLVGGFQTEPRGEVIIKGKGVMETYWLLCKTDTGPQPIIKRRVSNPPIATPPKTEKSAPKTVPKSPSPQKFEDELSMDSAITEDSEAMMDGIYREYANQYTSRQ